MFDFYFIQKVSNLTLFYRLIFLSICLNKLLGSNVLRAKGPPSVVIQVNKFFFELAQFFKNILKIKFLFLFRQS